MQTPPRTYLLVQPSIWATACNCYIAATYCYLYCWPVRRLDHWLLRPLKLCRFQRFISFYRIQKAQPPNICYLFVSRRHRNPLSMLCLEVWGWSVGGMSTSAKSKRNQRESNLAVPWHWKWFSVLKLSPGLVMACPRVQFTHSCTHSVIIQCMPSPPLRHIKRLFLGVPKHPQTSFSPF